MPRSPGSSVCEAVPLVTGRVAMGVSAAPWRMISFTCSGMSVMSMAQVFGSGKKQMSPSLSGSNNTMGSSWSASLWPREVSMR